MNTIKLRAILITVFCFVVALCSEIKSMDTASDLQETTSKTKNTNSECCLDRLKSEIDSDSSNEQLLLNGDENKDPETSWVSYISSPVKYIINGTYNIVDFAVKHPTQTVVTSLLIVSQFTAVAADCNCIWKCKESYGNGASSYRARTLGQFANETACMQITAGGDCTYYGCL
jgi:hypothetical protein